jgi:hypothetical protein
MTQLTEQEFAEAVAALMIESPDPENPDPQSNGYNWGLAHAEMILRGVPIETIKASLPR